jgi:transposase, IS30 family
MKVYHRISFREREEISLKRIAGKGIRTIANELNRSPSTISREINRNKTENNAYRAVAAQCWTNIRIHTPKKKRKLAVNKRLRQFVVERMKQYWSPEQIAKKLKIMYPNDVSMHVSPETIYSYLYVKPRGKLKELLIMALRQGRGRRRKKHKRHIISIKDMVLIDNRPPEAGHRRIPGHWEGDLVVGSTFSALGTLVERTTRLTLIVKVSGKDADTVRRAFLRVFKRIPSDFRKSLTYDQGKEMAEHVLFTKQSRVQVYFAHPHSPWERGSNENTNGLLRQFFPKGTDFDRVSYYDIRKAQQLLNDRPRKTLNWLSPYEVWQKTVALGT